VNFIFFTPKINYRFERIYVFDYQIWPPLTVKCHINKVRLTYQSGELMCEYTITHKESKTQFNGYVMN